MDVTRIRRDFPLLTAESPLIYFDNACATLKPESVLAAMDAYNREFPTCGGRSINRLGERVTAEVQKAREQVRQFINAKQTEEIVFVRNTTEGLNLLAHTVALQPGDTILLTDKEHNSNLVPWQLAAARTGAVVQTVSTHEDGTFDLVAYQTALQSGSVKVVAMGLVSNLDGVAIPGAEVVRLAHEHDALVIFDAAQAAPHQSLDVQALGVDFLVFSGHKLCGPSGTGVVYGRHDLLATWPPFIAGGSTVASTTYTDHELLASPERFEGGTQDYAGIIGLGAAVEYISKLGLPAIAAHETALNQYATAALSELPEVTVIGPDATQRGGIVSFYVGGIDIHQIAITLDRSSDVMVRSGQHCVHSWFTARNIYGSVRVSFYVYNTTTEIDQFVTGLRDVIAVYS